MNKREWIESLSHFNGTSKYYKDFFGTLYTDGVKFLADEAECYWLIDLVSSYQFDRRVKGEPFHVYELRVNSDKSAVISISDGNGKILAKQWIDFTTFPLSRFTLWYEDGVLLLPSEH